VITVIDCGIWESGVSVFVAVTARVPVIVICV